MDTNVQAFPQDCRTTQLDGPLVDGAFNPTGDLNTQATGSSTGVDNDSRPGDRGIGGSTLGDSGRGRRGGSRRGGRGGGRGVSRGCIRGGGRGRTGRLGTAAARIDPLDEDLDIDEIEMGSNNKIKRFQVSPGTLEKMRNLPLDQLCSRALKYAKYQRLAAEDKVELEATYIEYLRKVYLVVIKYRLQIMPALKYLGLVAHSRGNTNYNNYCEYDPDASKIYYDDSIHVNERARLCGLSWRGIDKETKLKFNDDDYLDSLPNPFLANETTTEVTTTSTTNTNNPTPVAAITTPKVLKSKVKFDAHRWVRKVIRDMRNLSTAFQVEGYVLITSRNMKGPVAISGGTILGERFLDLYAKTLDPCSNFVDYLNGQTAIKNVSGVDPPATNKLRKQRVSPNTIPNCPYDLGGLTENRKGVAAQLGKALYKATNGECATWPGKKTTEMLTKLKVALKVHDNPLDLKAEDICGPPSAMLIGRTQRILTALAKGWVELIATAPEVTDNQPSTIGFTDVVTGDNSTSVVVGRAKKHSKTKSKDQNTAQGKTKQKAPASTSKKPFNKVNQSRKKQKVCETAAIRLEGDWDSSDDEEDEDFRYNGDDFTDEDDFEDQTDNEGESDDSGHE